MVWNIISPDGSKSVAQNVIIQQQNTDYIGTVMGDSSNTSKDHFWNIGTKEGHHRAVLMENYSDTYTGAPTSPSLVDGMSLALFAYLNGAKVEAFMKNSSGLMQLLGIRAYAVWNNVSVNVAQTLVTSYNVTSVTRQTTGRYSVAYTTGMTSDNYQFFCGGMGSSDNSTFNGLFGSVVSGASVAARKTTASTVFKYFNQSGTAADALQGWLFVFGG